MISDEQLIKVFQQAQQKLVQIIATKEARGNVTWYQESLLKQVRQLLREVDAYSVAWANDRINESYELGTTQAVDELNDLGVEAKGSAAFAKLHTGAIQVIVSNTQNMLLSATRFVGRQIEDVVRQAGLEAVAEKLTTGATVKQAANLVKQKLVEQGINAITDKRGRMISLDAYAETVARSTTREATNTALMNQLEYEGYDLVKMSSHATTCPICAVYQGRVYSISGKSDKYPPISIPFSGGHANIHPRCRHVLTPYIPELAEDRAGDIAFSNRSFSIDSRSQAAIDRYNERQAEKRRLWADKNQFQRYKLVLGNHAPKTLAGFRRMKNAVNSKNYQELKELYKNVTSPDILDISEKTIKHASSGDFIQKPGTPPWRMKGGGHGQENIDFLKKYGITYNFEKTFSNGVRIGNVPNHADRKKRKDIAQSWFPSDWDNNKIKLAGLHVANLRSEFTTDGNNKIGIYDGVEVGVFINPKNNQIETVYPNVKQSHLKE